MPEVRGGHRAPAVVVRRAQAKAVEAGQPHDRVLDRSHALDVVIVEHITPPRGTEDRKIFTYNLEERKLC